MSTSRSVVYWIAISITFCSRALLAQPLETEEEPLPEIPETQVIGRPNPFPATPLGEGTLVTPSRTETAASESGSDVTVITQEQIAASRQTQVAEVLRQVVGLDVVQSGGPGRATSVFVRGANSEHTKVLIDGIPVNDPIGATRAFDFGALTVDNIERIEVARGPLSMEYGSDAIGGVINIITKRGEGPLALRVSGRGGSFGTQRESVSASGGTDNFYYSFGGSYLQSDGFSVLSPRLGGLEDDLYRNATLSGRFGWTPSPVFNVDYVFRYTDADVAIDGFQSTFPFLPADNLIRQNRNNMFFNRVQIQSALLDGLIEQKVGFSLTDYNRRDTDPGFFGTPQFLGQSRLVDWQANLQVLENSTLTAGVDYLQEEGSTTFLTPRSQNLAGVYLQDRFSIKDWSFTTIGVRWDQHSTAGAAQTYRFTQLFRIRETGTNIHGSIGRGFRAPALAQKFGFAGNPNLRPEFSKGWDIGVRQQIIPGKFTVDLTYFRNDFRNLIITSFNPGPPLVFQLQNVGLARATGVEAVGNWSLGPCTTFTGTYTFTNAIDLSNGRRLLRRPKNKATFNISRRFLDDCASVNLYFLYVGSRVDFDQFGGLTTLADYIRVDVSGKYRLSYNWEAFARIQNLTDSNYEEVYGFSTAGISGYGGMTYIY